MGLRCKIFGHKWKTHGTPLSTVHDYVETFTIETFEIKICKRCGDSFSQWSITGYNKSPLTTEYGEGYG